MVSEPLCSENEYRFCQFINCLNSSIDFQGKHWGVKTYFSFQLQVHFEGEEQPVSVFCKRAYIIRQYSDFP